MLQSLALQTRGRALWDVMVSDSALTAATTSSVRRGSLCWTCWTRTTRTSRTTRSVRRRSSDSSRCGALARGVAKQSHFAAKAICASKGWFGPGHASSSLSQPFSSELFLFFSHPTPQNAAEGRERARQERLRIQREKEEQERLEEERRRANPEQWLNELKERKQVCLPIPFHVFLRSFHFQFPCRASILRRSVSA